MMINKSTSVQLTFLFVLIGLTISLASCNSFDPAQSKVLKFPSGPEWTQKGKGVEVKIVQEGQGELIAKGTQIQVHYVGWYLDKSEFYNSVKEDRVYRLKLGQGRVIPAWEKSLMGLKKGTQLYVKSDHENAFGDGRADGLRSYVDVVFGIHILE